MSDDAERERVERRMRDALHAAPLPVAPDSLRDVLARLPDRDPADMPVAPGRRRWAPVLAFAAAAIAVVAVVMVLALPTPRPGPAATAAPSAAPTDGPSATEPAVPEPPASVEVLDATALRAAIEAQRAGGVEPQTVVTSVSIDPTVYLSSPGEGCAGDGTCRVIGLLDAWDSAALPVVVRAQDRIQAIPTDPAELRGPIALRLAGTAPIEFLGHVDVMDGTGQVDVAGLTDLTPSTPDGRVIAVDGWLAGVSLPSCGPVMLGNPPAPFDCPGLRGFLADEPLKPSQPEGDNGFVVSIPDTAVRVQYGAYKAFAAAPQQADGVGGNDEPRHGLYLVRMVVADVEGCPACRGWLVVGRLDGPTAPEPTLSTPSPIAASPVETPAVETLASPETPAPSAPTESLDRAVKVEKHGIRVTMTLDESPLRSGQPARIVTKVRNTGTDTLRWYSDECRVPVWVRGEMPDIAWRPGIQQDGNRSQFKWEATRLARALSEEAHPAVSFGRKQDLGLLYTPCSDMAFGNKLAPGETLKTELWWDGTAIGHLGPLPDGRLVLTGTFGLWWRGNGEGGDVARAPKINLTLDTAVTGGSGNNALSPGEIVDRALADPAFGLWIDDTSLASGVTSIAHIVPETGEWEVGTIRWTENGGTMRLIRVDPVTGAILGNEERPWVPDRDGTGEW